MNFFEFQANQNQKVHQAKVSTPQKQKKEMSDNLRLLILAIRLQRMVKNLPSKLTSAECITNKNLAIHYLTMKLSSSIAGAEKMAARDLNKIKNIFGLDGTALSGYVMHERFERFYDMFVFWRDALGVVNPSDKRMHILIKGLIDAIDNGFRDDPIIIADLARECKEVFKNKNIRDSKVPLQELFYNRTIAMYLCLIEEEEDKLCINKSAEPLLMRLKPRAEVGDNVDASINLATPGRIRIVFDAHIKHLNKSKMEMVRNIATSIRESHLWADETGSQVVPYVLYREGESGPLILTLWRVNDGHYRDIPVEKISIVPESNQSRFLPYNMPASLWELFRQITT